MIVLLFLWGANGLKKEQGSISGTSLLATLDIFPLGKQIILSILSYIASQGACRRMGPSRGLSGTGKALRLIPKMYEHNNVSIFFSASFMVKLWLQLGK